MESQKYNLKICVPEIPSILYSADHPKERYIKRIENKLLRLFYFNHIFNTTHVRIPMENNNLTEIQDKSNGFNPAVDQIQIALQRNECHFAFSMYKTPVLVENITQGNVFDQEIISLASVYKLHKKNNEKDGDALDSLSSFSENTLFLITFLSCFIGLMIFLSQSFKLYSNHIHVKWMPSLNKKKLKKTRKSKRILDICFLMFSSLIKVFDPFPRLKTLSMFLLWICFTSFGFYVGYFYSSMIKTDAVTVKTPDVAMSYQDILDMNLSVLMDGSWDADLSFKNANKNSLKGRIWMKNEEVMTPQSDLFKIRDKLISTKAVGIGYSKGISIFKNAGYTLIKPMKDLRLMITRDPSEEPILRVSAINSFLEHKYKKMINRRLNHVLQAYIFEFIFDMEIPRYLAFSYSYLMTGHVNEDFADIDDYVSSTILLDHPHILTPDLSYFYGLFSVVSIGFAISFLCLGI